MRLTHALPSKATPVFGVARFGNPKAFQAKTLIRPLLQLRCQYLRPIPPSTENGTRLDNSQQRLFRSEATAFPRPAHQTGTEASDTF
jgi:hypothetical protein